MGTNTACFWTKFCPPRHSPRGWTGDLRRPGTSPARPAWTTRSGPERVQRCGASRYDPRSGLQCKNLHARQHLLFREPVSVPMVLRDASGLTEATLGRVDAGKGKQGLKSLRHGPPRASFLLVQNAESPGGRFCPRLTHYAPPTTTHAELLSFGLCRCMSTPTCPRRSKRCKPSCLGRALASSWPPAPRWPWCRTTVKLNLRFEELASVMSGQSLADSGPPRTIAQLMLAHKKVS